MKLIEVTKKKTPTGTYAGYKFDEDDVKKLLDWSSENNIPNRIDDIHCTLLYSKRHCPNYKAPGKLDNPFTVVLSDPKVWTETTEPAGVLVIELDSPQMVDRQKKLIKEHNAKFDYDKYTPHITLSYNVEEDYDVKKLSPLPKEIRKMQVVEEYGEDLDENWEDD